MARKKKIASNSARGIATAYVPKKPVQESIGTVESSEAKATPKSVKIPGRRRSSTNTPPLEQPESREDMIARLVRRYESLNERKAETLYQGLSRPADESAPHKFDLTPELEQDLIQVLRKREEQDTFGIFRHLVGRKSHALDKDRFIGDMDILYRTLVQLGFDPEDVEHAFRATMSTDPGHVLDWLCTHVPYERMPVGFFDKYYTEEEVSIKAIAPTTVEKPHQRSSAEQGRVTKDVPNTDDQQIAEKPKVETTTHDQDMKSRILQAAERYYEDEEEEGVNERHAKCKLQISELESQLPSNKKKKKKAKDSQDIDVDAIIKQLDTLRKTLRDLEGNWEFDKKLAHELLIKEQQEVADRRREEQQLLREKRSKEPKSPAPQGEEDDDESDDIGLCIMDEEGEEEGGLFGALEMESQNDDAVSAPKVTLRVLDTIPKSWKGRLPRELLEEYCRTHDLYTRQTFSITDLGAQRWRASVKLHPRNRHDEALIVDIRESLAASSARDAEHLAALAALFQLEPSSSLYRLLPSTFKDLWQEWVQEKHENEKAPKLEMERKRMEFLVDLVNDSYSRSRSRQGSIGSAASPEAESPKDMDGVQLEKKRQALTRIQQEYRKRLNTDKYAKIKQKQSELPMAAYKQQVIDLVKANQVVMISGETGCGKSTQVPQFIAEAILQATGQYGSIICTQPRRISAMSIANRVSYELGDHSTGTKNSLVGYQIRLESKVSDENVVVFCTTGILLRRLESDRTLQGITHVIVDEVHERSIESDFLLIILKRLCQVRPDLRIILMSATVKAERFMEYFGYCPVISVPGRTFPVSVNFLEDVVQRTGYVLESDSPFAVRRRRIRKDQGTIDVSGKHGTTQKMRLEWYEDDTDDEDPYDPMNANIGKVKLESRKMDDDDDDEDQDGDQEESGQKYSRQTMKMIRRMDENKINYDLLLNLLENICLHPQQDLPGTGAILVFLPGMPEIRRLYDILSSHPSLGDSKKYLLIPLHSTLSSEHQEKAFETPPEGIRKIVLSTNIAETGVTISDVTIVIDTGMAKVVSYDQIRRVTQLKQTFVAKANALQRRGRAGRVQEGVCFHLFTRERFEQMADFETPEILRLPLEEICLRIKVCGLGSIRQVLDAALDRPSEKMIDNAIQTLQEVQALSTDETLTPLGAHLADLPVDVHIGKMILFGAIFRCLDPVLTIAAALSFKSPFVRPFGKEAEADMARARYRHADSDFWAIYNAYSAWRRTLHQVKGTPGWRRKVRDFCEANFLSQKNLEMIEDMKRQYFGLLVSIGFVRTQDLDDLVERYDMKETRMCPVPQAYNVSSSSVPVVNAAITAGLYPKFAERRGKEDFYHQSLPLKIHPSSLLFGRERILPTDFLVYNTVVMSRNTVYMWEAAVIDAVTIMLLASNMEIRHKQKRVILDNWLTFECFARSAVLIKFLRTELNNWLSAKMSQPDLEMDPAIMDCTVKILERKMDNTEI